MLLPRKPTPALNVETLDHGHFDLPSAHGERGTLICFYRGYHCPICATYLSELSRTVAEFAKRGVNVVAISSDTEERARLMQEKIRSDTLPIGYGLSLKSAREMGPLYLDIARQDLDRGRRTCLVLGAWCLSGAA